MCFLVNGGEVSRIWGFRVRCYLELFYDERIVYVFLSLGKIILELFSRKNNLENLVFII